jgi:hypothetical protein
MGLPPGADALDRRRAGDVIAVGGLVAPAPLAGGLARLAARRRGAGALAPSATGIGSKAGLTVLALALPAWTSHGPASPQAHEQGNGVWKEENGQEKRAPQKIKEDGRTGCPDVLGKKTPQPTRQFQLNR